MTDQSENVVEAHEVTKSFGDVRAVDRLSFGVPTGTIYGFIGPNGSGKTTTLRMIMNIFHPDSGTITVFGNGNRSQDDHNVGYLPEERGLYKKMKVRDVLNFYGGLKGGQDIKREVAAWLEKFDLSDWGGKKVETLSKGMSQKVQFIAAVVPRPKLLILDEPFAGLDPVNADAIREAILELRSQGTTVMFSTHDMHVAERMCDSILMIFRGAKVLDGDITSIKVKYGRDTIRIRSKGGATVLADLNGVEKISDFGRFQELRISKDTDSQQLLAELLRRTEVESFEIAAPSLHDIFIRIAGPEAQE